MISNERPLPYGYRPTYPPRPPVQENTLKYAELKGEHSIYVFMLKVNARGLFIRITERTGHAYTCLIIPDSGLAVFQQLLDKMVLAAGAPLPAVQPGTQVALKTEEVQIERKFISFRLEWVGHGVFLRITEAGSGRQNIVVVPAASLVAFQKMTDEFVVAAREQAAAGGAPSHPAVALAPTEDIIKNGQMQAGHRNYTFQFKKNAQGHFLRIVEEKEGHLNTIIIPIEGMEEFKKWIMEMTKAAKKVKAA